MFDEIYLLFCSKILEKCKLEKSALIYCLAPGIDTNELDTSYCVSHNLESQKNILDCALSILANSNTKPTKRSYEYQRIKEEKENFFAALSKFSKGSSSKISDDKLCAALSVVSRLYFESFFRPIPFFLPYSSAYCGHFKYWDKMDYLMLRSKKSLFVFNEGLLNELSSKKFWQDDVDPSVYPLIVRRRLIKEKAFDKEYSAFAMIKAVIISLGGTANINYEVLDQSLRSFIRYLEYDKYVRVDREIEFLKLIEKRMYNAIDKGLVNFN